MPFSLGQILGGWRRKAGAGAKATRPARGGLKSEPRSTRETRRSPSVADGLSAKKLNEASS